MKKMLAIVLSLVMVIGLCSCNKGNESKENIVKTEKEVYSDEKILNFEGDKITYNGVAVTDNDKNDVYTSHDITYYEDLDKYPSGNFYGEGEENDKHTSEEAKENVVVNISKPGIYRLSGTLTKGQIKVDLGEEAKTDVNSVVTLVLDNFDITCDVAPAILFNNVYECDNQWSVDTAKAEVDTLTAGANIVISDNSKNTINGSYVAKIYKDNTEKKKLVKQDGALYSYMSMNISSDGNGNGELNVIAEREGIDSELHLTINSGKINIISQDDGINTNEDNVSVTTINGGVIHIIGGLGQEGDGIDSNGYLVINGGTVIASANPISDCGLDSDCGSFINGGTVVALGSTMEWPESDSNQATINLQFTNRQNAKSTITVKDEKGNVVFEYDIKADAILDKYEREFSGAILSCDKFEVGKEYTIYINGKQLCHSGVRKDIRNEKMPFMERNGEPPEMPSGTDNMPPVWNMPNQPFDGKAAPNGMARPNDNFGKGPFMSGTDFERKEFMTDSDFNERGFEPKGPGMGKGEKGDFAPETSLPAFRIENNDTVVKTFTIEDKVNLFINVRFLEE